MSESKKKVEKVVPIRKGEAGSEVVESTIRSSLPKRQNSPVVQMVRRVCTWIVIISAVVLAFISILSVWTELNDIADKAWLTFWIILVVSGFIGLVAPLLDQFNSDK